MPVLEETLAKLETAVSAMGGRADAIEKMAGEKASAADVLALAEQIKALVGRRGGVADGGSIEERTGFSPAAAFRALKEKKHGGKATFTYETKLEKDTRERVMDATSGPNGGFLVPPEYMAAIIAELESETVVSQLGAQTLRVRRGVGQVVLPKETSGPSFGYVGERGAVTESQSTLAQLGFTPHRGFVHVRATASLLRMATVAVDAWLRARMQKKWALGVDRHIFRGTGAENQPLGILNLSGLTAEVAGDPNGGPVTLDLLQQLQIDVDAAKVLGDRRAWVMHARAWGAIRKLRDAFDRPLVEPNVVQKEGRTLLGDPVFVFNEFPIDVAKGTESDLTPILYGRFQHLINAVWEDSFELSISKEASDSSGNSAWLQSETWYKLEGDHDSQSEHVEAYATIPDVDWSS